MKKLLLLILLVSFVSYGQTQYYIYKSADSTFVKANYYDVQPNYSTTTAPTIDVSFAKWNGSIWVDYRTPAQILKAQCPDSVTRKQLKLQLTLSGFNMSTIDSAINSLPEPNRSIALISWNDSSEFDRNNTLLQVMASMLGISDSELDQIFIDASKL